MAVKKTDTAKVAVYLDRATGGEENYVRVGVNGKMYQVPRGKTVMVPRPVYDVLRRSATAKAVTEAFVKENEQREMANTIG
jgi:hypothetical protein